jgi:hypothetical protein
MMIESLKEVVSNSSHRNGIKFDDSLTHLLKDASALQNVVHFLFQGYWPILTHFEAGLSIDPKKFVGNVSMVGRDTMEDPNFNGNLVACVLELLKYRGGGDMRVLHWPKKRKTREYSDSSSEDESD